MQMLLNCPPERKKRRDFLLLISLFCFILTFTFPEKAICQFNHPELKWKVVETDHFLIHYHQKEENFALNAAEVAENIYQKLTSVIGYHPRKKIPIVIENYDDKTGGYTSLFQEKIVIQAQSDPLQSSGNFSWMKEVIGHELTHYISFAAIDESLIPLRKALTNLVLPMWFVEGLAQYLGEEWHSLKEMIVSDQAKEGKIMSEGELGAFYFFDGWGRMSGYYQSDSLVRYIFETYGKEKISKIFENLRNQPLLSIVGIIDVTGGGALYPLPHFVNFNQALKEVLGKDSLELYREWREWIFKKAQKEDKIFKNPFLRWGRRAQSPVFSPEGNYLAFVSNKGYDYAIFDLYLMNLNTKRIEKLVKDVNPYICFSPDGKSIVYSKTTFLPSKRVFISDLYQINIFTRKIKRLTSGERAFHPVFSPSGDKILFVKKEGGNSNLCLFHFKDKKIYRLTSDKDGVTQNFAPAFSPDGEKIVFVRFYEGKRDIFLLELKEGKIYSLTNDEADDRCPVFSPEGKRVIFVSDRKTKTFNLWSLDIETKQLTLHTRIEGGIFDPALSSDGEKIAFSQYQKENFSIYIFPYKKIISRKVSVEFQKKDRSFSTQKKREILGYIKGEKKPLRKKIYPYQPQIKINYIFPWFSISEEESFFSIEALASDTLEKHTLMCQALLSDTTQYEVIYLTKSFEPTFWIDVYKKEGTSSFKGETFPVENSVQQVGAYLPVDDKISLGATYLQQRTKTSLLTSTLEPVSWKGVIRSIKANLNYLNLIPVREYDLLPWGTRFQIEGEWASKDIGSELDYLSFYSELRSYLRMSKNSGIALKIKGKKIKNISPEPLILFSLKEGEDVRGYPQEFLDCAAGENLVTGSVEYRVDLKRRLGGSSAFFFDTLSLAFFFDAGSTWREKEKFKEEKLYKDAGAEIRLRMLPFGKYSLTMRFGISWPFDYKNEGKFFLSFGGIF